MKLRAVHTIYHNGKTIEPGKGFDCSKESAAPLLEIGAAVLWDSDDKTTDGSSENEKAAENSAAGSSSDAAGSDPFQAV